MMRLSLLRTLFFSSLLLTFATFSLSAQSRNSGIVTAAQVNGTWSDNVNTFKILALGKGRLKVQFDGTYAYRTPDGEEMANIGTYSGVVKIDGVVATITMPDDDPECRIVMTFTGGKMEVTQAGICGFGHNVNASGTYVRTSRRKPRFDQ